MAKGSTFNIRYQNGQTVTDKVAQQRLFKKVKLPLW